MYQLPKYHKIFYNPPSNNLDYTIVNQKIKVSASLLEEEILRELKDKHLLSSIKKARLEYKKGLTVSEEEVMKLLSD